METGSDILMFALHAEDGELEVVGARRGLAGGRVRREVVLDLGWVNGCIDLGSL